MYFLIYLFKMLLENILELYNFFKKYIKIMYLNYYLKKYLKNRRVASD